MNPKPLGRPESAGEGRGYQGGTRQRAREVGAGQGVMMRCGGGWLKLPGSPCMWAGACSGWMAGHIQRLACRWWRAARSPERLATCAAPAEPSAAQTYPGAPDHLAQVKAWQGRLWQACTCTWPGPALKLCCALEPAWLAHLVASTGTELPLLSHSIFTHRSLWAGRRHGWDRTSQTWTAPRPPCSAGRGESAESRRADRRRKAWDGDGRSPAASVSTAPQALAPGEMA